LDGGRGRQEGYARDTRIRAEELSLGSRELCVGQHARLAHLAERLEVSQRAVVRGLVAGEEGALAHGGYCFGELVSRGWSDEALTNKKNEDRWRALKKQSGISRMRLNSLERTKGVKRGLRRGL